MYYINNGTTLTFTSSSDLQQYIALFESDSNTETGRLFIQDGILEFVGDLNTAPACFLNTLMPLINDYINRTDVLSAGHIPTLHSDSGVTGQFLKLAWKFNVGLYAYVAATTSWSVAPNNIVLSGPRLPTGNGLGDDSNFVTAYYLGQQFYLEYASASFKQGIYVFDGIDTWNYDASISFGTTFPVGPDDGDQFYLNTFENVTLGTLTINPALEYSGAVSANALLLFNAVDPLISNYINTQSVKHSRINKYAANSAIASH